MSCLLTRMTAQQPLEYTPHQLRDICFELDTDGLIGAVDITRITLSVWHVDHCEPSSHQGDERPRGPVRALTEAALRQLCEEAMQRQPHMLHIMRLRVNMRQFCELIVPHLLASGIEALAFEDSPRFTVDDVALLSEALVEHGVQLRTLMLPTQNTRAMRGALVRLCATQAKLEYLVIDGFDDSRRHAGEPYALVAELIRTSTTLKRFMFNDTPPTPLARAFGADPTKIDVQLLHAAKTE